MSIEQVVSLLSDGKFHSGEELGGVLGVSRAAVWKKIKKLSDFGLDVHSVRGKGYRVPGGVNLLNKERVVEGVSLDAAPLLKQFDVLNVVPSTNDVAMRRAGLSSSRGYVCTAEQQSKGRGRRGRDWVSPFARNVYFSSIWEFHRGAAQLEGLSLAAGVAVARALEALGVRNAGLKWPNDVVVDGRKVGGILLEMSGDAAGVCHVVLGIGLNVDMPDGVEIDQDWVDIKQLLGRKIDRNDVVAALISEVLPMLKAFENSGFEPFLQAWHERDVCRDKKVTLATSTDTIEGVARGVDVSGGIVLQTIEGERVYKGGEISLRVQG